MQRNLKKITFVKNDKVPILKVSVGSGKSTHIIGEIEKYSHGGKEGKIKVRKLVR
jgi:hypothetical protein